MVVKINRNRIQGYISVPEIFDKNGYQEPLMMI